MQNNQITSVVAGFSEVRARFFDTAIKGFNDAPAV